MLKKAVLCQDLGEINELEKDNSMCENIFKIFGLAFLLTACVEEMPTEQHQPASSGDAVQFTAGLNGAKTRTIYGEELEDGSAIKVNWVQNDRVSVYGESALDGKRQGTYKVTAETGSAYAGNLQMLGSHGVQWGTESKSRFYAVYPSVSGDFTPLEGGGVSVPMSISNVQNNFFAWDDENGVWRGVQGSSEDDQTMTDAIMYACTDEIERTAGKVSLRFNPFSTVVKFRLEGVGVQNGITTGTNVFINRIDVTASNAIVGTFPLNIANGTASVAKENIKGSNTVIIKPYSIDPETGEIVNNLYVTPDEPIEFSVFTIPQPDVNISKWTITVETTHGTRTFTINSTADLLAGQIHKVNVPVLNNLETDFKFNPENWIAQLPTTVLLSELSIPGAWYSTNPSLNDAGVGYQASSEIAVNGVTTRQTDLEAMYAAGIRAFNIDTRLTIAPGLDSDSFDNKYTSDNYTNGNLVLTCAGTEVEETERFIVTYPTGVMNSLLSVESAISSLGSIISRPENQDEFIVIVLTIAEKAKTHSSKTYGTIDSEMMLHAIADVLNGSIKNYIYDKKITEETTIDDVLGKIVVKVNINDVNFYNVSSKTVADKYKTYKAPMMITYGQMSTGYEDYPIVSAIDYSVNDNLHYVSCQAQSTTTAGFTNRKTAIDNVTDIAFNNYTPEQNDDKNDLKKHAWYQLGIGGAASSYEKKNNEYTYVAEQLNLHTYNIIKEKLDNKTYSPVGIVLMNQATNDTESVYSSQLIDAILTLNARIKMEQATAGGSVEGPLP